MVEAVGSLLRLKNCITQFIVRCFVDLLAYAFELFFKLFDGLACFFFKSDAVVVGRLGRRLVDE